MGLRAGYKQTDVGVIPEDWDDARLGAVCMLVNGRGFKPHEWGNFGYPIIRIQNLNGSDDFNYFSGRFNPKLIVENDQLLFAWSGSRGTSFGPHIWRGQTAVLNYHTWKVITFDKRIDARFFFHALRQLTKSIEDAAHGASALVHTQKREMENYLVPVPQSLDEQRAIAAALSDADALIASLDALIAKKRDLKQAAMQQLLTGKTRLPGFAGDRVERSLAEVCLKIQDGTHFSPVSGGNDFLYITSKNIGFGQLELRQTERISAIEHAKIYARCDTKVGDLLLTKDGANTGNAALNTIAEPISLLSSVAFIRFPTDRHDPAFFLYQILSSAGQKQIKEQMSGNAITRLTLQKIKALRFKVPQLSEQSAIAAILSDMDAELTTLEARRDKAHAVKQGMMQELLTGRIRLV